MEGRKISHKSLKLAALKINMDIDKHLLPEGICFTTSIA